MILSAPKANKRSGPATGEQLESERERIAAEIRALEGENRQIDVSLPAAVASDPSQAERLVARADEIGRTLPAKRRTLDLLAAGILDAQQREKKAALEVRKDGQDRATEKLASRIVREMPGKVAALVELLRAADDDARAWRELNRQLSEAGLMTGDDAEERARRQFRLANRWTFIPFEDALIPTLEGDVAWGRLR